MLLNIYSFYHDELKVENNRAFSSLYKSYFKVVEQFILIHGGTKSDAHDIFQDTMIVLLEKLRKDEFILSASIKTYLVAISKNLWLKKLRNEKKKISIELIQDIDFFNEIDDCIDSEIQTIEDIELYIKQITEHCQRFIQDVFLKEKTIKAIQKEYGYSNLHNAQNQKYKCLEQLRKRLNKKI